MDGTSRHSSMDLETASKVGHLSLRSRIQHLTWAWYTLTMSTGGIALILNATPHRFTGLDTIGTIVFILDLVLFSAITVGILVRFLTFPGTFISSMKHPTESLFFATFWLSLATIQVGIQKYGVPHAGPWLPVVLRVLFWVYAAGSFIAGTCQYQLLFMGNPLSVHSMTPSWVLPIFPGMLSGTIAANIASSQPPAQALPIMICGLTFQGLGFLVSLLIFSIYLQRLMTKGLPNPNTRPGMFISVGPPAFTALTLIGIANETPTVFPFESIAGVTQTSIPEVLKILALVTGIFIWSLAFWFFCISTISVLIGIRKMTFHLVWWSFVFPNVGFTISVINIGKALNSEGILWVASGMSILLVAMWLFVGTCHIRAVWRKEILWPGKDEDHDQ